MNELNQAYIRKICFKNYKSLKNLEIDCHSGLNIIIGQNGSGKTNFVQAIHSIFSEKLHHELPIDFEFGFDFVSPTDSSKRWTGAVQEKTIENQANKPAKIKVYKSKLDSNDLKIEKEQFFHIQIIAQLLWLWDNYEDALKHIVVSFGLPSHLNYVNSLDNLEILYDEETVTYFFHESHLKYFENIWRLNKKQITKNFKKHFKINANLVKHLKEFSPIKDCRISQGYNIQQKGDGFIINHVILEFFVNNNWYSWEHLSDGTKRLFYIISKTLSTDCLVMLEEPEVGIHPDQLYKLMDFLKEQSKYKQIIITTHSPDALNILTTNELHKIIVTRFDPEKGTLMHHLSPRKIKKARLYMSTEGLALKDFWVHSNLEALDETTED